ncbi:MAG: LptA/OstA family protein [Acidobacteria bacterium]|nr:LptA/OstA family protein [Acidobacteriota bacterium]MBU4307096.1 LptA/OstA family protein [Acidobacteriota bacterium]MCG2812619.1 LptA/OstA family protein [Candidatus Aminicenantes bacterium]
MRKKVKVVLIIIFIVLSALFAKSLFFKKEQAKVIDTGVEDRDITYLAFNDKNKKSVEVKCQESFTKRDDELHLKKISAVIYKSGKMNKDIHFFSDWGIAKNDFNYFQIQKNARIISEDFTINAESFLMTSKKYLFSKEKTYFIGKNISGIADKGIEFLFELNEFKMFEVVGKISINNQVFDFKSRILWMFKEKERLELKGESSIRTVDSLLLGDEIVIHFSNEFSDLQSYVSLGNSSLHSEKDISGNIEVLEIRANTINSFFGGNGNLERILIFENGRLKVENPFNRCEISSDNIDCRLFPQTQNISQIFIRTPGEIKSRGSQNVDFSALNIEIKYSEKGDMQYIKAEKNVQFTLGDFKGSAPKMKLDAENSRLDIVGKEAEIKNGVNLFAGPSFIIDTKKNQMSAQRGVKATIFPDKGNVLFRPLPLYITADNLEIGYKGRNITFKNKVKLFQDEIELSAREINFNYRKNLIIAQGHVSLKFVNGNDVFVLGGELVSFESIGRQIVIQGDAQLNQGGNTLKAKKIILHFVRDERLQNISAQDDILFATDKIFGKSQLLSWQFDKKLLVFKNEAQISNKNSGTTRGQELLFDLSSNEISVSSADDRSETVIRQETP